MRKMTFLVLLVLLLTVGFVSAGGWFGFLEKIWSPTPYAPVIVASHGTTNVGGKAGTECGPGVDCPPGYMCVSGYCKQMCTPGQKQTCSVCGCPGTKTCGSSSQWLGCMKDPSCPTYQLKCADGTYTKQVGLCDPMSPSYQQCLYIARLTCPNGCNSGDKYLSCKEEPYYGKMKISALCQKMATAFCDKNPTCPTGYTTESKTTCAC